MILTTDDPAQHRRLSSLTIRSSTIYSTWSCSSSGWIEAIRSCSRHRLHPKTIGGLLFLSACPVPFYFESISNSTFDIPSLLVLNQPPLQIDVSSPDSPQRVDFAWSVLLAWTLVLLPYLSYVLLFLPRRASSSCIYWLMVGGIHLGWGWTLEIVVLSTFEHRLWVGWVVIPLILLRLLSVVYLVQYRLRPYPSSHQEIFMEWERRPSDASLLEQL